MNMGLSTKMQENSLAAQINREYEAIKYVANVPRLPRATKRQR